MSSVIVDRLFELRDILKAGELDEAHRVLRQLIMEVEKAADAPAASSDPLAERIRDWLGMFLDEDFALELARLDKRRSDEKAFARHVVERHKVFAEGLQAASSLADIVRLCELLGHEIEADSLRDAVRELQHSLRHHLILDEKLRVEVSSLGQFLANSLARLEEVTNDMGGEESELNKARHILSEPLSEDPGDAYEQLRRACDFLSAAEGRLDSAVRSASEQMQSSIQEVDQLRGRLQEAQQEARQDPLTGLANRRELNAYLQRMGDAPATVLLLDLDRFKSINDTHGHDVGDQVLAEIGSRLGRTVREDDLVARIGGEEFVVVLNGVAGRAAGNIAEQIRQAVSAHPVDTAAGPLPVTASAGAAIRRDGETVEPWMKRADQALYAAKQEGRDRTRMAD